ncbi:hypothetical protein [Kaistella carnis]|uniref:Uncharacterized protein n=1 Tax=Kaistella carnis TaxID=1241979 RepID=A0A3G8XLN2_9FLAO|nr:hypothetical protein [Kaistella carnis]AZI33443.1 hypothetical protein EIB73_09720 [Kaistella carnis]
MKTKALSNRLEQFGIFMLTFFFSIVSFAQEKTDAPDLNVDVTTTKTTTTEEWFTNPLYWVVGALLLIILVAVIARGNKRD